MAASRVHRLARTYCHGGDHQEGLTRSGCCFGLCGCRRIAICGMACVHVTVCKRRGVAAKSISQPSERAQHWRHVRAVSTRQTLADTATLIQSCKRQHGGHVRGSAVRPSVLAVSQQALRHSRTWRIMTRVQPLTGRIVSIN